MIQMRVSAKVWAYNWPYSEAIQGQKYETGQEFRSHTDYFDASTPSFAANTGDRGQRTWTFMVYLNDVAAGGATRFPHLDRRFRPRQGSALIWNNLDAGGQPIPATLHHGMKPLRGEKYVLTKWFREKGFGPVFV